MKRCSPISPTHQPPGTPWPRAKDNSLELSQVDPLRLKGLRSKGYQWYVHIISLGQDRLPAPDPSNPFSNQAGQTLKATQPRLNLLLWPGYLPHYTHTLASTARAKSQKVIEFRILAREVIFRYVCQSTRFMLQICNVLKFKLRRKVLVCLPEGKRYPPVNIPKNYGKIHHAYWETHYFDWAIFNSKLLNYQRVFTGFESPRIFFAMETPGRN